VEIGTGREYKRECVQKQPAHIEELKKKTLKKLFSFLNQKNNKVTQLLYQPLHIYKIYKIVYTLKH